MMGGGMDTEVREFLAPLGLRSADVDPISVVLDDRSDNDVPGRYFDWSSGWERGKGFIEVGDGNGNTVQVDMTPQDMVRLFAALGTWIIENGATA